MSWVDIFFSFRGRINRKAYWLAGFAVSAAGLGLVGLISYLAMGSAFAPEVWNRSADHVGLWLPVWIAYYAILFWPQSALAVKRLHDRGHSSLTWYIYFAACVALAFIPAKSAAGAEPSSAFFVLLVPVMIIGAYLLIQTGVLRGTPGANAYGPDTLPADYHGGDYSFASLMLAVEGRISRSKWWLGVLILFGVMMTAALFVGATVASFVAQYQGLEQNLNNPDWIKSPEGVQIVFKLTLWLMVPSLAVGLAMWSFVALGLKRLHDRGLSSWLILVVIAPFIALLLAPGAMQEFGWSEAVIRTALLLFAASVIWSVLQFGILKGEAGPNSHGPDPAAE